MEMIYDVRQRGHTDPHFVAGIQPQPGCAARDGAADGEYLYGGCCKTTGSRAVCGNGAGSAGRVADGAFVVAVSPAEARERAILYALHALIDLAVAVETTVHSDLIKATVPLAKAITKAEAMAG